MITLEYPTDITDLLYTKSLSSVCKGITKEIITDSFIIDRLSEEGYTEGHFYVQDVTIDGETKYVIYTEMRYTFSYY